MTGLPTWEERQYITAVCDHQGWPTVYVWQALVLWMRLRPQVMTKTRNKDLLQGYMVMAVEIAVSWLGPQQEAFKVPIVGLSKNVLRSMMRHFNPKSRSCNRRTLQLRIFLEMLGGRCR